MNNQKFTILDLDNCISNDEWRIEHIRWDLEGEARYHDYHLLAGFDEVGNRDLFEDKQNIIVFTARPVSLMIITEEWLKRAGVDWTVLLMRPEGDRSHSRDLKRAQLQVLPNRFDVGLNEVDAAYDDREDVVQMYRDLGIKAEVRKIHDTCAYTKGGAR